MKELTASSRDNGYYKSHPIESLYNGVINTDDKITINIPQFTVNIPLETTETLTLSTANVSEFLNNGESNLLRIMLDKRKLLISQPQSKELPRTIDEEDHEVDDDGGDDDDDDTSSVNIIASHSNINTANSINKMAPSIYQQVPPIHNVNGNYYYHNDSGSIKSIPPTVNFATAFENPPFPVVTVDCDIKSSNFSNKQYIGVTPSTKESFQSSTHTMNNCNYYQPNVVASRRGNVTNIIVNGNINPQPHNLKHSSKHTTHKQNELHTHSFSRPTVIIPSMADDNCLLDSTTTNENTIYHNKNRVSQSPPSTNNSNNMSDNNESSNDNNENFVDQVARIYITDKPTPRDPTKTKPCNCQKTGCLKLYCECFARGDSCLNCSCKCCLNTPNDLEHWLKASNLVKSRRKTLLTMSPKNSYGNKIRRGCNCRRSLCLKKYCECFDKKVPCTKYCRCTDCCNGADSQHTRKSHKTNNKNSRIQHTTAISNTTHNVTSGGTSYTDQYKSNQSFTDINSSDSEISKYKRQKLPKQSLKSKSDSVSPLNQPYNYQGYNTQCKYNIRDHNQYIFRSKLHVSQSFNDLTGTSSHASFIPHYTKSSSTPNLNVYSSNINHDISSTVTNNTSSTSDVINNKQMLNKYLSLIAKNPNVNE